MDNYEDEGADDDDDMDMDNAEDGAEFVQQLDSMDQLVVTLPFLPGVAGERLDHESSGNRSILSFRRSEADAAVRASRNSGMSQRTPAEVFDAVEQFVSFGVLQQSGIDGVIKELSSFQDADGDEEEVAGGEADAGQQDARRLMRSMLDQLRLALHAQALGPHQAACALLPLCAGSKSDKLAVAFRRMGAEADGRLSQSQLWTLLLSLAAGLRGMRASRGEPGENNLQHSSVKDEMANLAVDIVEEASGGSSTADNVSFDDFGQWFNTTGGRARLQWIDLEDMRKWPGAREQGLGSAPSEQAAIERASE